DRGGTRPLVLEPARRDLRVRLAVQAACFAILPAERLVMDEVDVVAQRVTAGWIVERLGVGWPDGRELRRPAEVDEDGAGLASTDGLARLVVAERADVTVRFKV